MPDVLGAVENAERQPGEEIPRREVTRNGPNLEAGFPLQEHVDVLKLGQIVLPVAAVLHQLRPVFHVLRHGMLDVQFVQLTKHGAPGGSQDGKPINWIKSC